MTPRRRIALALAAAVLLLAAIEATQTWLGRRMLAAPVAWSHEFEIAIATWLGLALLVPLVAALAARFPVGPHESRRHILLHAAASLVFPLCHVSLAMIGWWLLDLRDIPNVDLLEIFLGALAMQYVMEVLVYWLIVGAWSAASFYRKWRIQELDAVMHASRAAELAAGLNQAKLGALRAQLHPHFLFNTLNAIATLAEQQQHVQATEMTRRLSGLLRTALEQDAPVTTLARELDFVERYLAIERVRFGERLSVHMQIDPRCREALVPSMLLQPLVENAIKHGISARAEQGSISITASLQGDTLHIRVQDDGPGLGPAPGGGTGIGLENTRARLQQLYGAAASLELQRVTGGGVAAEVSIPMREPALT